jgi:hypothetical protein
LLDQSNTKTSYASATTPANINRTLGDEKLYLKGGRIIVYYRTFGPDADNKIMS